MRGTIGVAAGDAAERRVHEDANGKRAYRVTAGEAPALRPSDRQLLAALRQHGQLDRAELARLSGMPRSTVTDSIARLQLRGEVIEHASPAAARSGVGRPPSLLTLAPPAGVLGFAWLTHEAMHAAVLTFDGTLHARQTLDPYEYDASDRVAGPALELLDQALSQAAVPAADMKCVVVGMPAPVTGHRAGPPCPADGPGLQPARSSLAGPHVPADPSWEMTQTLGVPAWLENDANLAALGEGVFGVAAAMPSFIYIKMAHGIGAGLVLDRRLHRGAAGLAGELAHIHVEDDGAVCRCGGRGCLMTTFNARRLVDRIRAVHPAAASMADVMSLAARGDAGVWRLLRDLGRTIGRSIADVCVYVAPDGVVIDGVLETAATPVIEGIREAMYQFAPPAVVSQAQVVVGALAGRAELHGAAVLARYSMFGHDLLSRPALVPVPR